VKDIPKLTSFHQRVTVERQVKIPMRDGIILSADIYRPKGINSPLPVLLMRLPYGRAIASTVTYAHPSWYANQGYIVVIQDVRGCGTSEGEFYPFRFEYEDGYDTVNWCAEKPGSNGKVGMYGFSYQGVTQFQAAVMQPPGLVTICPAMATVDFYDGWFYFGGAIAWEFVLTWALQLSQDQAQFHKKEPLCSNLFQAQKHLSYWLQSVPLDKINLPLEPFFFDWINHNSANDSYWQGLNPLSRMENYDLPALHIAGWADLFITATFNSYKIASHHTTQPQKLLIAPWQHIPWSQKVGEVDFGIKAISRVDQLQIDWFDFWLKGVDNGIVSPLQQFFLMGKNEWIDREVTQEKEAIPIKFYLNSDKKLDILPPSSDSPPDIYVYDPRNPTPSSAYGQYDQCAIDQRWDILVYQGETLTEDLSIIGVPKFQLFAATSATDTDWVIKLLDIYPDGKQMLISMGVIRAKFRNSFSQAEFLEPDRVYEYQISLRPTAHCFLAGHRLGIAIASAAFPLIERHGNIEKSPHQTLVSEFVEATQRIYFSAKYPSCLYI